MRVPTSRRDLAGVLASVLACTAPIFAQSPPPADAPLTFTAPDGSRFHLIARPGLPVVHWAIATPAGPQEDPPGLEGLAVTCVQASLHGTFRTGSRDRDGELAALEALDRAAQSGDPTALAGARIAADDLADRRAFRRSLAAAPTSDLTVDDFGAAVVVSFRTTPAALAHVAELLVERREDNALRHLVGEWQRRLELTEVNRQQTPFWALRAEAFALAYPGHPLARTGEVPPPATLPARAVAREVWLRTQRPDRTVHVLLGDFEPGEARAVLERAFARTGLQAPVLPVPAVRGGSATRSSTIPGPSGAAAVVAFRLRGDESPDLLEVLRRWLSPGPGTFLAAELQRRGITDVTVACGLQQPGLGNPGLLLLELSSNAAGRDLGALALELARAAAAARPSVADVRSAHGWYLAQWERDTRGSRSLAATLALAAIRRGDTAPQEPAATPPTPAQMAELLGRVFGRAPDAVVQRQAR